MRKSVWWALVALLGAVFGMVSLSGASFAAATRSAPAVQHRASTERTPATTNAPTPPMGWNSYNAYACDNGSRDMEAVGRFLHSSGLEADGYTYVNSDGCYDDNEALGSPNTYGVTAPTAQDPETCGAINGRLRDGELFVNAYNFPSSAPCANDGFKVVGDYLSGLGLKLGVYLDASNNWNCEEIPGSYGFDQTDAATLAAWGVSFVKLDWGCKDSTVPPASNAPAGYQGKDVAPGNQGFGGPTFSTNPAYDTDQQTTQVKMYTALVDAIRAADPGAVVSIAGAGTVNSQEWGLPLADMDRPTGDANANFTATGKRAAGSVVGIVNADAQTYDALTSPGHWVDPDAMEVGNGSLTPTEDRSEMSMFSEMTEPLLMSTNLCAASCGPDTTPATPAQLALATSVFGNKQVIAVDQDPLGAAAHIVGTFDGTHLTMAKPLANGDVAVTLFNESTTASAPMSIDASDLGLPASSSYTVSNLWSGKTATTSSGSATFTVAPTQTVMLRISAGSSPSATAMHTAVRTAAVHARSTTPAVSTSTTTIPANLLSVSCSSDTQCTGVDIEGSEVTFDPHAAESSTPQAIDAGRSLVGVSCPTGGTACVAVDRSGSVVSFDPTASSVTAVRSRSIDPAGEPTAITCPTTTQCTVVDGTGREITVDPATGAKTSSQMVDPYVYLAAVSCPTTTQCTAAGGGGNGGDTEVTFNPTSGSIGAAGVTSLDTATVNGVSSVACPTESQCTVVDGSGNELTFDPTTGGPNASGLVALEGDGLPAGLGVMTSVTCPSVTTCTAVDVNGSEVTFDPSDGTVSSLGTQAIDGTTKGLESVSCVVDGCVAVDLGGRAVSFVPATGQAVGVRVDPPVTWTPGQGS